MPWQILIGISVTFFAVSTLLQRVLLKDHDSDPVAYSIFFQLLIGILIGIFGFFITDMSLPDLKPLIFNLTIGIIFYALANVFIFNSLKRIEASKYSVIFTSRALFTVFASSLLLKESLSLGQFFGAALLLGGILIVTLKDFKIQFNKGELFAFIAAILFGFATTNDRLLLQSFNLYPYVSLSFIIPPILIAIVYPKSIGQMKVFLQKNILIKMIILCVIYSVSALTFFAALQSGSNSSQITTVNLSSVILTVILSAIFLKERDSLVKKILGATLSFAGLVLLTI
ncbi:MAG: DMT family transporter [Candidatus Daviesbacteria bacterium]|nr:DMT family transporter [Candidatus Daviesbacteria bacterium]